MRIFTLLLLCGFVFNVSSTELTPSERMLNAMGIDQILNQAKAAQAKASKEQVAMVMRQLSGTLSKVSADNIKEIEALFQEMIIKTTNSWSTEEAIKIYSQTWADNFTENEILDVVKTYEQPEYKKQLEMVLMATASLNNYITSSHAKASEVAFADFIPKLQLIIKNGILKAKAKAKAESKSKISEE